MRHPGEIKDVIVDKIENTKKTIVNFCRICSTFLVQFCDNSNIHGVRYFSERRLHWSERMWWMTAFFVSIWLCTAFIHNTWMQWNDNPVTMSFTEKARPISAIPFPTVTICPETKTNKERFDIGATLELLANSSEVSDEDMLRMDALTHICALLPDVAIKYAKFPYVDDRLFSEIQKIAPRFMDTLQICWWQNKEKNCTSLVSPVLTEEGLCFTFNALNSDDIYRDEMAPGYMVVKKNPKLVNWTLENGYAKGSTGGEYPIRVVDSGRDASFDVGLGLNEDDFEYQCRGFDQGYRVILTPPGDALRLSRNSFRVPISEDTLISIRPKLTITSEGLKSYSSVLRQCVFQSERWLRFYRVYGQRNCEEECVANYTRIQCGCVKFSMPRDKQTKVCGAKKLPCYKEAEKNMSTDYHGRMFRENCNCLPTCTTIDYSASIDRVKFDVAAMNLTEAAILDNQQARLAVFFRDQNVETVKRMEVYTYSDFLAVCGGLLGLFLGVSVLSIIEFVYYSSLRYYWRVTRSKKAIIENPGEQKTISIIPVDQINQPDK